MRGWRRCSISSAPRPRRCRSAEAKDDLDIDAILTDGRVDLPAALAAAQAIYGPHFNPLITLKALSFFDDGDLHLLPPAVRDRLAVAARAVDPERLPRLRPAGPDDAGAAAAP